MAGRNTRRTSAKAAQAASKVLSNPKSSKAENSAAASATVSHPNAGSSDKPLSRTRQQPA